MTEPFDEYGERLRYALHTEADTVVPSPDGLERIRDRISSRQRRFGLSWFATPWLRPVAAVSVAVVALLIAVTAPPMIQQIASGPAGSRNQTDNGRPALSVPGVPGPGGTADPTVPSSPELSSTELPSGGATPPASPTVAATTCPPGEQPVAGRDQSASPTPVPTCAPIGGPSTAPPPVDPSSGPPPPNTHEPTPPPSEPVVNSRADPSPGGTASP